MKIYVRAHVFDYDPTRILLVTLDRDKAFLPYHEISGFPLSDAQIDSGYYDLWEGVTVWEDGKIVESWERVDHEWRIRTFE